MPNNGGTLYRLLQPEDYTPPEDHEHVEADQYRAPTEEKLDLLETQGVIEVNWNGSEELDQPTDPYKEGHAGRLLRNEINPKRFFEGGDDDDDEGRFQAFSFAERLIEVYNRGDFGDRDPNLDPWTQGYATVTDPTTDDEGRIFWNDGTHYLPGESHLKNEIRRILRDAASTNRVNEVVKNVKTMTGQPRQEVFDLEPHKLPVGNGIVNLRTGGFTPYSELSDPPGALVKLDVNFDASAVPHEWNEALSTALWEEDIPRMWELIGYTLLREYPWAKAFMFYGEGANGKSTISEAITEFLGQENVSAKTLHELGSRRFATAELEGKIANIAPEISDKALYSTDTFKSLTGGDLIDAQRKYEHPFQFRNYATLIFSANTPPAADDETYAYGRRWTYFEFPNQLDGEDGVPRTKLLDRLRGEHSGVLNKAIEGVQRLYARDGFEETVFDREADHEEATRPILRFVREEIESAEDSRVRKQELEGAYAAWCAENDVAKQGWSHLKTHLDEEYAPLQWGQDPTDKKQKAAFDIRLVNEEHRQQRI